MGVMKSNWAKLEPGRTNDDDRGDYWVPWDKGVWTTLGEHGNQGAKYTQELKEYPSKQPIPDGVPTRVCIHLSRLGNRPR